MNSVIPELPFELWTRIMEFVQEPQTTALVSLKLKEATQIALSKLFNAYENNSSLKPYVEQAKKYDNQLGNDHNKIRVKHIFQNIIQQAKELDWKKQHSQPSSLSIQRLEEIVCFIENQKKNKLADRTYSNSHYSFEPLC